MDSLIETFIREGDARIFRAIRVYPAWTVLRAVVRTYLVHLSRGM